MATFKNINLQLSRSGWLLVNANAEIAELVCTSPDIIDLEYDYGVQQFSEQEVNVNLTTIVETIFEGSVNNVPHLVIYNKVKHELFACTLGNIDFNGDDDISLAEVADYALRRLPQITRTAMSECMEVTDLSDEFSSNASSANPFADIDKAIYRLTSEKNINIDEILKHIQSWCIPNEDNTKRLCVDDKYKLWAISATGNKEIKIGPKPKSFYLWVLEHSDGVEINSLNGENSQARKLFWEKFHALSSSKGRGSFNQYVDGLVEGKSYYNITNINKAIALAFGDTFVRKFFILTHKISNNKGVIIPAVKEGLVDHSHNRLSE